MELSVELLAISRTVDKDTAARESPYWHQVADVLSGRHSGSERTLGQGTAKCTSGRQYARNGGWA